jgi:hypothetical protein
MTIIVSACRGCNKIQGTTIQTCSAYEDPWKRHRLGRCPLHSVPLISEKKVVKINPLKASKRATVVNTSVVIKSGFKKG